MAESNNKKVVIAMRTALKAGKNLPLLVFGDNAFVIVDESKEAAFTKWDDTNGILYYFRLLNPQHEQGFTNETAKAISVSAIKYEFIQAMEVSPMPLKFIDNLFETINQGIGSGGAQMKPEFCEQIKHVFNRYTDQNMELNPDARNAIHGVKIKSNADDYYNGRFYEQRQAQFDVKLHNLAVKKPTESSSGESSSGGGE